MWQMYQKNYQPKREYLDHLTELGKHYLNTPGVKNIRLRTSSKNYLKGIYRQIVKSNEKKISHQSFLLLKIKHHSYFHYLVQNFIYRLACWKNT